MFEKNTDNLVNITNITKDILTKMLRYIYTGKIYAIETDQIIELLAAADKYQIDSLKINCEKMLSTSLYTGTAIDILIAAHKYKFNYRSPLVEEDEIPAHKIVLSAASPVFRAMFTHDMLENNENSVKITDITEDILTEMLSISLLLSTRVAYSFRCTRYKYNLVDDFPQASRDVFSLLLSTQVALFVRCTRLFFGEGTATQTALLGLTDDVRQAVDDRKINTSSSFDFQKRLTCGSHQLLLQKLRNFNLSDSTGAMVCLVSDANVHRRLRIREEGSLHGYRLPQRCTSRSVLGPLLFILFINDLLTFLVHSKHMMFADDLQIYSSFSRRTSRKD
ncbi:unnamed protein product [Trichogramma brassicae]|uniref:BTB domain-containing protein n=1 Tax=Trichogramma brassicae TaxID=86971 RepID=A0A6H5IX25_9HYME|nr:unnamed protein product [Trichogramma brassicae]